MRHQHGKHRTREDVGRCAAEEKFTQAGMTIAAHNEQIRPQFLRLRLDRITDRTIAPMHRESFRIHALRDKNGSKLVRGILGGLTGRRR